METIVAVGLLGLGYFFNKDGKINRDERKQYIMNRADDNGVDEPNGDNIYQNKRSLRVRQFEQKVADNVFNKSKDSVNTNVMIAGPPLPIFNKADNNQEKLPIEFDDHPHEYASLVSDLKADLDKTPPIKPVSQDMMYNITSPDAGNNGISLTGEPINPNTFVHNNMQPFFGSNSRQNVDQYANRTLLENFTGNQNYAFRKREQKYMFDPKANMDLPYGFSNLDGYNLERYIVGNKRNNENPIERVNVGRGLNMGYTAQPSGGFQQANTRDYVLPLTTNEIRVKTNPKISYYGRIIAGKKISKPPKIGIVEKNRPDTFYVNTPDRYMTTIGVATGPTQRPRIPIKYTNRKYTSLNSRIGPAAPTHGTTVAIRSKHQVSHRPILESYGFRNADATGMWSLVKSMFGVGDGSGGVNGKQSSQLSAGQSPPNDYGRSGVSNDPTKRSEISLNTHTGNVMVNQKYADKRVHDKPRQTRKQTVIGAYRWGGNIEAPHNRHIAYDPNTYKTRTTLKEQLIHDSRVGNFRKEGPPNGYVYDPNNFIAKTTVKQQTVGDTRLGSVGVKQPRHTIQGKQFFNPKTTTRETYKNEYRGGGAGGAGGQHLNRSYVKMPNMRAKTTTNETTLLEGYVGDASQTGRGYNITKMKARNTNAQFTSNTPYTGVANAMNKQMQSYTAINNSTIGSNRQIIGQGRPPVKEGPKLAVSGDMINASTKKTSELNNAHLLNRGVNVDCRFNSIPQANKCQETRYKQVLSNQVIGDRFVADYNVEQFKRNPYTKPLDSFFFP